VMARDGLGNVDQDLEQVMQKMKVEW
jgi:hypothetical protein